MKTKSSTYAIYFLLIGLFCLVTSLKAAPSDFDPTFSDDGRLIDSPGMYGSDTARDTATQPDGKTIIIGSSYQGDIISCGITRFNVDGTLDTAFGGDGKVVTFANPDFYCYAVAVQADGKIVVAGSSISFVVNTSNYWHEDFTLFRYNTDGTLDTTFDGDGKVITNFTNPLTPLGAGDEAFSLAIQPDGKIIAGGSTYSSSGRLGALVRYNPDGSLDNTFSDDGKVTTDVLNWTQGVYSIAIQSDGKIVAAGSNTFDYSDTSFGISRFNTDGSVDVSFGNKGKSITNLSPTYDITRSIVIQPDGKMLLTGWSNGNLSTNFVMLRYLANGSLDTMFDNDGIVVTDYSGYSAVTQPDGKIVAVGSNGNGIQHLLIARYNNDGSLDETFNDGGIAESNLLSSGIKTAIQPDGKIVAVGSGSEVPQNADFAIIRYNSDGSLDTTFDDDGAAFADIGKRKAQASITAIQPDGKIIVAGATERFNNITQFALARYNSDGSLDQTFGNDGKVETVAGTRIKGLAVQPDGKILAVGENTYNAATGDTERDFFLVKYNPDGSLDKTFALDGKVRTSFGSPSYATAVALQADGKIVVSGYGYNGINQDFRLARYNSDGSLDASFGNGGKITTEMSRNDDFATAMALQSDGKIVVVGYSVVNSQNYLVIARYHTDGSLDNSFNNDGRVSTKYFTGKALAIQPNGKIVVTSNIISHLQSLSYNGIIRYNADGSLDTAFNSSGIVISTYARSLNAVAVQPNGKIIAGGFIISNENQNDDFALIRYNPDGSPDSSFQNGYPYVSGIASYDIFSHSADRVESIALDSTGKIIVAGTTNNNFALARIIGDQPSAPSVLLSGRVTSPQGQGIGNVKVTITNSNGESSDVMTGSYGNFMKFVSANETYTISVSSKRYNFSNSTQIITPTADVANINFIADN